MEKQERLYHHTRYEVLDKIIRQDGIVFKGSYFEKFDNEDYKWTKSKSALIIKRICEEGDYEYCEDSAYQPIIISFCKEGNSDYMWENYANHNKGVQVISDYKTISSFALDKLDYLGECVYIEDAQEIDDFLMDYLCHLKQICINDHQYNLEALSGFIKKPKYAEESEVRYIHTYPYVFKAHPDGKGGCVFEETKPSEEDKELYVYFPKEALLGISLGCESEHTLEDIHSLLNDRGYNADEIELKLQRKGNIEV